MNQPGLCLLLAVLAVPARGQLVDSNVMAVIDRLVVEVNVGVPEGATSCLP